jgi:chorismate mutase
LSAFKGKYDSFDGSFLDFMFVETEKLHALNRRYTSPDENAFYPHLLPDPMLPNLDYPRILKPNAININAQIMNVYLHKILPDITEASSDHTSFGSTATADIAVLQSLSKRIHFGKFIAEAKFQAETEKYTKLIQANDTEGIMEALTNLIVEEKVLKRVKLKASTYGQDIDDSGTTTNTGTCKVDPQVISNVYRDFVMPLTKQVQVAYLLKRLDRSYISVAGMEGSFAWQAANQHFGQNITTNKCDPFILCGSISEVFTSVCGNRSAYGIVPLEDSASGMIKETKSLLIQSSLKVCAEVTVQKAFVFAVNKNKSHVSTSEVTTVYVPSFAEGNILRTIELKWPLARVLTTSTSPEAAENVMRDTTGSSIAVTTTTAVARYNLEKIDVDIATSSLSFPSSASNSHSTRCFIRYVVIGKGYPASTGKDKTCLSMQIQHQVGSLLSALEVFKVNGVNMSSLESLYRHDDGGYDFFVEILGHFDDSNIQQAIQQLQKGICEVKHLGSFPRNT